MCLSICICFKLYWYFHYRSKLISVDLSKRCLKFDTYHGAIMVISGEILCRFVSGTFFESPHVFWSLINISQRKISLVIFIKGDSMQTQFLHAPRNYHETQFNSCYYDILYQNSMNSVELREIPTFFIHFIK